MSKLARVLLVVTLTLIGASSALIRNADHVAQVPPAFAPNEVIIQADPDEVIVSEVIIQADPDEVIVSEVIVNDDPNEVIVQSEPDEVII